MPLDGDNCSTMTTLSCVGLWSCRASTVTDAFLCFRGAKRKQVKAKHLFLMCLNMQLMFLSSWLKQCVRNVKMSKLCLVCGLWSPAWRPSGYFWSCEESEWIFWKRHTAHACSRDACGVSFDVAAVMQLSLQKGAPSPAHRLTHFTGKLLPNSQSSQSAGLDLDGCHDRVGPDSVVKQITNHKSVCSSLAVLQLKLKSHQPTFIVFKLEVKGRERVAFRD